MTMQWGEEQGKLLNPDRLGSELHHPDELIARTHYQRDLDRIIFSSSFRRMHGKTQVFPLPESDVIHTRLTHSLEVASVGRSLGTIVASKLAKGGQLDPLGEIVAAASLAHDIGNPPFGHSGEDAIADFFKRESGKKYIDGLLEPQAADLMNFEGNALGFRLLAHTRPQQSEHRGGLRLTFATLAAFTKYRKPSIPNGRDGYASEKKFGFFQSDAELFKDVAAATGLIAKPEVNGWARHPLAFLMEAADDICYRIVDVEDGFRHQLFPYDLTRDRLHEVVTSTGRGADEKFLDGIKDRKEKIGYLRAKAINALIHECSEVFVNNVEAILAGEFDQPLIELTPAWETLQDLKRLTAELIYAHRPVLQVEAAGFQVLAGLLGDFLSAIWEHPRSQRAEKVLALIPRAYVSAAKDVTGSEQYNTIMSLAEYVASMTDNYAIDTYRTLRGIELPNY